MTGTVPSVTCEGKGNRRSDPSGPPQDCDAVHASTARKDADARSRDPLYLFACHLDWHCKKDIRAYQELVAVLVGSDQENRTVAEALLHRS